MIGVTGQTVLECSGLVPHARRLVALLSVAIGYVYAPVVVPKAGSASTPTDATAPGASRRKAPGPGPAARAPPRQTGPLRRGAAPSVRLFRRAFGPARGRSLRACRICGRAETPVRVVAMTAGRPERRRGRTAETTAAGGHEQGPPQYVSFPSNKTRPEGTTFDCFQYGNIGDG